VARGLADETLLDAYDAERRPVGRSVVRFTDRAFSVATSTNPLVRTLRTRLVPRVLPLALRFDRAVAYGLGPSPSSGSATGAARPSRRAARRRALALLGVREVAHYLVRPDGHVGYRAAGTALDGLERYLARWLPGAADPGA
jgi:hypothetical protein